MNKLNTDDSNKLDENSVHENNPAPRRLWLDDVRPAPRGYDWAKNYSQAVQMMSETLYDEVSLDHDLADWQYAAMRDSHGGEHDYTRGRQERTGYHVALWMVEHSYYPRLIAVHSLNPVGSKAMIQLLQSSHPDGAWAVIKRWPA